MEPTSSAQAAEAARKHPLKTIRNRLRNIAPSSARGHTEPSRLLSGLETLGSNWPKGQGVPKGYRLKRRVGEWSKTLRRLLEGPGPRIGPALGPAVNKNSSVSAIE